MYCLILIWDKLKGNKLQSTGALAFAMLFIQCLYRKHDQKLPQEMRNVLFG